MPDATRVALTFEDLRRLLTTGSLEKLHQGTDFLIELAGRTEDKSTLTLGALERLALLMEECAEVQKVIGKILRHGYESHAPKAATTNREDLAQEVGDVLWAIELLLTNKDIPQDIVQTRRRAKPLLAAPWLHHQE